MSIPQGVEYNPTRPRKHFSQKTGSWNECFSLVHNILDKGWSILIEIEDLAMWISPHKIPEQALKHRVLGVRCDLRRANIPPLSSTQNTTRPTLLK